MELEGRVAFVTGMARGQGRAEAVKLAQEGADIIGVDICGRVAGINYPPATQEDLKETIRLVESLGRRILARQVDIRDLPAMEAIAGEGVAEFGRLDIVVANAGVAGGALLWDVTPEQWESTISVVLTGCWHTIKVTVPHMIKAGNGGSIIMTGSAGTLKGAPFLGHYNAAKYGIVGLSSTLANEVGEYRIRVNAIHPYGVDTIMNSPLNEATDFITNPAIAETLGPIFMTALPAELMAPSDIAEVVAFLASDRSRFMTGLQIPIDLGLTGR